MAGRRLLYLAALTACLIFHCLFDQWLTWVLLLCVFWLPALSLLVSLPAIGLTRLELNSEGSGTVGVPFALRLLGRSKLPFTALTTQFRLRELNTGSVLRFRGSTDWTPKHCGAWELRPKKCYLYDYMGLVRLPAGRKLSATVYIMPVPVPMENIHWADALIPRVWKPKSGGGFSENHDLRLYRPGDDLRHIHWKMSAKTGKLICREPMEAAENPPALLLTLPQTPEARDLALGKLLWLSRELLGRQREHTLHCLTGSGLLRLPVRNEAELTAGLHRLLTVPGAPEGTEAEAPRHTRCFRIGGDGVEA